MYKRIKPTLCGLTTLNTSIFIFKEIFMPKKDIEPIAVTNYIAISRAMIIKLGCADAIVLSDIFERYRYWCNQGKVICNAFYYTTEDMEKNLGLTYKQQLPIMKRLESKGYIQIIKCGSPAKRYFRILDKIYEFRTADEEIQEQRAAEIKQKKMLASQKTSNDIEEVY